MTDYWVSKGKHWCLYCEIYISNDKASIKHHEGGLRHKGNFEKYIGNIYKRNRAEDKRKQEEKIEIEKINAAAEKAVGSSVEKPKETSKASTSKSIPASASTASDPYANYTSAAELGIRDELSERLAEEEKARQNEGRIGSWTTVIKTPTTSSTATSRFRMNHGDEDDEEEQHRRRMKAKEKSAPSLDDDDYVVGSLKLKKGRQGVNSYDETNVPSREEVLSSLKPIKFGKTDSEKSSPTPQPEESKSTPLLASKEQEEDPKHEQEGKPSLKQEQNDESGNVDSEPKVEETSVVKIRKRKGGAANAKNSRRKTDF